MTFPVETRSELARLRDEIKRGTRVISLGGLTSVSAKAFVLSHLQSEIVKTFVVVTDSNKDLETFDCDLEFFNSRFKIQDSKSNKSEILNLESKILNLPSFETDVYSGISPHAETQEKRALALWNLAFQKPDFLILSAKSLITKTIAPKEIINLGAVLKLDEDFPLDNLIEKLVACGYVREEPIKNVGEFSVRGGILDVWSPAAENPVRIEFFGDTVDSIREFDAETQLSINQIKQIAIAPMREYAATAQDFKDWAFFAREHFTEDKFARALLDRTQFADEGESFSGWEFLFPLVQKRDSSVFDFLADAIFVIDEPAMIEQTLSNFYESLENHLAQITEAGEIGLEPRELFFSGEDLREKLDKQKRIELRALGKTNAETDEEFQISDFKLQNPKAMEKNEIQRKAHLFLFPTAEKSVDFEIGSRSTRKFHGNIREFAENLNRRDAETQSLIVANSLGIAERLTEILRECDVKSQISNEFIIHNSPFTIDIAVGDLSGGFEIPSLNLTVFTETDIFGEITQHEFQKPQTTRKAKSKIGAFISDFRDLKVGDYVVHVDHGIGRFEGLETIKAQGTEREFMLLTYADNARLFVPVERLDLVSRYSSGEGTAPTLDRLGGLGWQKTKAKAKRAMRDMADELLRLYAERKFVQGFAFSKDAPWQKEFEDAFPYQLTIDQATAIVDVK